MTWKDKRWSVMVEKAQEWKNEADHQTGEEGRSGRQENQIGAGAGAGRRSMRQEHEAGAPDSWSHCLCSQEADLSGVVQL